MRSMNPVSSPSCGSRIPASNSPNSPNSPTGPHGPRPIFPAYGRANRKGCGLGPRDVPGWPARLPPRPGSGSWPWSRRAFRQRACRKVGSFLAIAPHLSGRRRILAPLPHRTLLPCSLMPKLNHQLSSNDAITWRAESRQLWIRLLRCSSKRLESGFRPGPAEWRSTNELQRHY